MSSNTSLYRLTKKKVDELSKILKVDSKSLKRANTAIVAKAATRSQSSSSGPDTHVIRNIQNRINNPLFSLTIICIKGLGTEKKVRLGLVIFKSKCYRIIKRKSR